MAEILDCVHGVDLMRSYPQCRALVQAIAREYEMQTSGTFPQLARKDSVTRPAKKGSSSKKGGGKGC